MKKIKIFGLFLLAVLIFIPLDGYAQEDEDLAELSLEELMDIDVSTVSKKKQSMSDAPAIITVIKPEQIEEWGVQTLTELMTYVPGFTVADSYWKRQIVTARGVKMTLYNDKILMLINGVPAYDAAALEHYLDVMPVTSINRIEIIRGPGSTLYGTNAFSAVINIITKDGKGKHENGSFIGIGSHATREAGISFGDAKEKISYHFGATLKDDDGYIKEDVLDEYTNAYDALVANTAHPFSSHLARIDAVNDIQYEHDNYNFFGNITMGDFSVQSGYMYQEWSKFGPLPGVIFGNNGNIASGGRAYQDKIYTNLIYEKQFSDKLNSRFSVHYDYMDKQSDIGAFGVAIYQDLIGEVSNTIASDFYRFGGWLWQAEGQVGYTLNKYISMMAGISYENRTTRYLADLYSDLDGERLFSGSTLETGNLNEDIKVSDVGGYLQFDGSLGKLKYVAGLRATYLGISQETNLTPRAGLVYGLSKNTSIKLLYGQAFRGAGPQEQYYKVPILVYGADALNVGLKPEKINTLELALDQTLFEKYKLRLNGYMITVIDIINRRPATADDIAINPDVAGALIYDNLGENKINGLELEFNGYPSEYLNFFTNFSYKYGQVINADTVTYDYIPFMENITANAGLTFKLLKKKLMITPTFQYVGPREGEFASSAAGFTQGEMHTVDAYGLLHLTLRYKIDDNLLLSISGRNLLDAEYFYPEDVRRRIPTIPGGPGRSFFLKLHYNFN